MIPTYAQDVDPRELYIAEASDTTAKRGQEVFVIMVMFFIGLAAYAVFIACTALYEWYRRRTDPAYAARYAARREAREAAAAAGGGGGGGGEGAGEGRGDGSVGKKGDMDGSWKKGFLYGFYVVNPSGSMTFGSFAHSGGESVHGADQLTPPTTTTTTTAVEVDEFSLRGDGWMMGDEDAHVIDVILPRSTPSPPPSPPTPPLSNPPLMDRHGGVVWTVTANDLATAAEEGLATTTATNNGGQDGTREGGEEAAAAAAAPLVSETFVEVEVSTEEVLEDRTRGQGLVRGILAAQQLDQQP